MDQFSDNLTQAVATGLLTLDEANLLRRKVWKAQDAHCGIDNGDDVTPVGWPTKDVICRYPDVSLTWRDHLKVKGWVAVPLPSVMKDIETYQSAFWGWLETIRERDQTRSLISRHVPSTWKPSRFPTSSNGVFSSRAGHMPWLWSLREQALPIWQLLLGDEDLLVSFDGVGFRAAPSNMFWLHTDHGRDRPFVRNYQSFVTITDAEPESGGLVVVEGSHKEMPGYWERNPVDPPFGRIDMTDPVLSKLPVVKVCAPAGCLVIWESRTIHCNLGPINGKPRMVAYMAMQKRSGASDELLELRKAWYFAGLQTNHLVYFPDRRDLRYLLKGPEMAGLPQPRLDIGFVNETQRRMIGF